MQEFEGKMEFTYQFDKNEPRVVVTLSPQSSLDEVLLAFDNFLRGAGYVFVGQIDIVDDVPQDSEAELN